MLKLVFKNRGITQMEPKSERLVGGLGRGFSDLRIFLQVED